jgi:hypothetical protein
VTSAGPFLVMLRTFLYWCPLLWSKAFTVKACCHRMKNQIMQIWLWNNAAVTWINRLSSWNLSDFWNDSFYFIITYYIGSHFYQEIGSLTMYRMGKKPWKRDRDKGIHSIFKKWQTKPVLFY